MSFINIAEWAPRHVVQWLQGLESCIQPYVQFFFDNQINGTRLLSLTYEDLEKIHITKIGHQEIILDSIDLLRHLHYNSASENLQNLALKLGCKSRSLYNYLRKESNCGKCENCKAKLNEPSQQDYDENEENQLIYSNLFPQYKKSNVVRKPPPEKKMCRKISTFTIASVYDILISVKQFVNWIDRYSFERLDHYTLIRQTILRISIELASTTQRDHFVENPKVIIIYNCLKFAKICDTIVQEFNDSLMIQPASLEMVPIKRKEDEELGVNIHSSYRGVHVIGEIKIQSPAHRCGRIEEGDEIVQINYQTVLAWQQHKVILAMREYPTKIVITIKKRPSHSSIAGQLRVLQPTKIPNREVCIKTLKSPIAFQEIAYLIDDKPKDNNHIEQQDIVERKEAHLTNSSVIKTEINNQSSKHDKENIYNNNLNNSAITVSSVNQRCQSTICLQNHENKECCEHNTNQHEQLIEQMSIACIEKPAKGPVYPVYQMTNKPKKLKRRATIHGFLIDSPQTLNTPIRLIEDLVNLNNTENYCLNLNKSFKTSNLTMDDALNDEISHRNGSITTNSNMYKSFSNLYPTNDADYVSSDHQVNPTIIRRDKSNLNKFKACSEDDSQFIKRTVSVCYNEVHGVNTKFYSTNNYLSLSNYKQPESSFDKNFNNVGNNDHEKDKEFNQITDEDGHYYIRNEHNNATVIQVNSSPSNYVNFESNANSKSSLQFAKVTDIQVGSDNKNIVHVINKEKFDLNTRPSTNATLMESKNVENLIENKQSQNNKKEITKANQVESDNLKIDKSNEQEDSLGKERKQDVWTQKNELNKVNKITHEDENSAVLKPEIIKRKKSLNKHAKLIKNFENLNCHQLRTNSDHQGWLNYLREELNAKSSQVNFELNLNRPDIKWKENYLILKHELLYFYPADEDIQPCRILNLPTFELDDELDYRTGMHVFKIKSQKYRFYFASSDLNSLNEWIIKIKIILEKKKDELNDVKLTNSIINEKNQNVESSKINSNDLNLINKEFILDQDLKSDTTQYHSFNETNTNQINRNISHRFARSKNFKHAYSSKDLNSDDQNGQYLNGMMSKSSVQLMMSNDYKFDNQLLNHLNNDDKERKINHVQIDDELCSNYLDRKYGNQRFGNKCNGSYIRSQSCIDSNIVNDYTKNRLKNKDIKEAKHKSTDQTSSINNFSRQNQINQFTEQNQFNKQQEQLNQNRSIKEMPRPQPRISKMKIDQQNNANFNFVGKIINSFDELSKQCEKELEHYSSLRKQNGLIDRNNKIIDEIEINSDFNSYPRYLTSSTNKKEIKKIEQNQESLICNNKTLNPNDKSVNKSENPKYLSMLDREYNRLFKDNPPSRIKTTSTVKPSIIQTATSKEIMSIYLKQQENLISNSLNDKCNSPISDHSLHSLSSSSGISSYYSMGHDLQTAYSSTNFNFSPNSKNSSFEQTTSSTNEQCNNKIKIDDKADVNLINERVDKSNEKKKETKKEEKKQVNRKSSFNSFRLFGSSKKLSSSSKNQQPNDQVDQKILKNKNFLTSPRLKRSFFGLRKNSLPITHTTAVQTDELNQIDLSIDQFKNQFNYEQNHSLNHFNNSFHLDRIKSKSKSSEFLNNYQSMDYNQLDLNNKTEYVNLKQKLIGYELNIPNTPDTMRKMHVKPAMGINAMLQSKRRSSSVSCDRVAIESAFQIYNKMKN